MNDFVDRIDQLLKLKKLNRVDLSKALNIPANSIAQWKQRGSVPNALTAVKIANYLNTSTEYLVMGEEKANTKNMELQKFKDAISKIETICNGVK